MIGQVLYAGPLFDRIEDKVNDFKSLLLVVLGALVVWLVLRIMARTGSWVKAITAIIIGAIVLWGAANITTLRDAFKDEAKDITGTAQIGFPDDSATHSRAER